MTIEHPLVSIIVPVRNGERFVGRTLASAAAQTYDAIEVVVVDDGSTDRTAPIVEAVAARDGRVRLVRGKGTGVAAARNAGIIQARGALIAPLDADDLWHPRKIELQADLMRRSRADVGLVYCWSTGIDEDDVVITSWRGSNRTLCGRVTSELIAGNFIDNSSSPLIKRSCLDAVGGYDTALVPHGAEDWKLYLALSEICEFAVIPEYLVGYRQWKGSISRNIRGMERSMRSVESWTCEKWPDMTHKLRRQRRYDRNLYLSRLALEDNQLIAALRYRMKAHAARPATLLERSNFWFGARFVAQLTGREQSLLQRSTRGVQDPVTFHEL